MAIHYIPDADINQHLDWGCPCEPMETENGVVIHHRFDEWLRVESPKS